MSKRLQGVGGAPGIAIGQVVRLLDIPNQQIIDANPEAALTRFQHAQELVVTRLQRLAEQLRTEGRDDEAGILDAQSLLAEDISLTDEVQRRVRDEQEALEPAVSATITQMRDILAGLDDPYLRERAADIDHVGQMIKAALHGTLGIQREIPSDAVIVAADLTPAETAELRGGSVAGFATAVGGATGHTAILARSLGIPAIVGLGDALLDISDATDVILDGDTSTLVVEPAQHEIRIYEQRIADQNVRKQQRQSLRDQPGQLADGHAVALWANIGHPDDALVAREQGAEGVGLFRTEFLFLHRNEAPTEEEQYIAYCSVLETMEGRPVVVRTLDIGGDKPLPYLAMPTEPNPFLGVRGLRLCMNRPDLFTAQLRALLRAATHGDLWIMLPMVATPQDFSWATQQLTVVAEALQSEKIAHRADVPLGIMIETPAAAITADILAKDVSFFSIGSNDLTQYTMAADRGLAELVQQYPHDAPAVLRLIACAVEAGKQAGIPVGVCGELASEPEAAIILAGLGVDELSMTAVAIPEVKERLLAITRDEACRAAQRAVDRVDD
ncbi:MAG: phosphoenolpyruvate--protein phosphotransferase [Chloroflexi bacterium AL-W]|nr:phosphoenolpyruvate--protein phosphotransferase [Chloroflexi bacterium AL-N1]NOK68908.1 phosphoenolpyruvate--protein phosphotransferase [Chloroflexi bacterium AL-N10]NOK76891.1 phosphoenolpyruvate--protein phosphotransferase [Chloroflexi bacterium AL-N5]NOK82721.1 phosphoenolpyruvate--protein phosphotransferase [Chloroflexi bacterium AL-W]NOK90748.1 phosphoenolpyruvate--protein phosphotransferase [Chloroflexi bacterium AL-N15]